MAFFPSGLKQITALISLRKTHYRLFILKNIIHIEVANHNISKKYAKFNLCIDFYVYVAYMNIRKYVGKLYVFECSHHDKSFIFKVIK